MSFAYDVPQGHDLFTSHVDQTLLVTMNMNIAELKIQLSKVGLTLPSPPPSLEPHLLPRLHTAGDQRADISTAEAMRSGKGW